MHRYHGVRPDGPAEARHPLWLASARPSLCGNTLVVRNNNLMDAYADLMHCGGHCQSRMPIDGYQENERNREKTNGEANCYFEFHFSGDVSPMCFSTRQRVLLACLIAAELTVAQTNLSATPITIQNPSFETQVADPASGLTLYGTPIDSWVSTDVHETGQWDINAFPYGCWSVGAPDGKQIAYAAYLKTNHGISQVLSDNVQANTIYTLTGYVGACIDPANPAGPSKYAVPQTISLLANNGVTDTVLSSSTFVPPAGTFQLFTLTFNSTGSSAVGQALKISLIASAAQVGWDDIKLDASLVPEPSSILLAAIGCSTALYSVAKRRKSA